MAWWRGNLRFLQLYSLGDEDLETRRGAWPSEAATPSSCRRRSGYEAPGGKAATKHGVRRGANSTKGRAWRRRAGDDARAIHGPRAISRSRRAVASHLARVEVDGVERGGFFTCAASRSEFGHAVPRCRRYGAFRSTPSRVLAVVRASAAPARLWVVRFARLDVYLGLGRTRAGARVGNAPVA